MSKALLQINASLFSDAGVSSTLANRFVAGWKDGHPGAAVISRDLAKEPVPHLTAERFQAFISPVEKRDANQRAEVAYSDPLIEEVKRQNKPYGLYFDQVTGGYTTTGRQGLQAFTVMPLFAVGAYGVWRGLLSADRHFDRFVAVLVALAERAGRVLTRDQIMELVRGKELEAFDRSIDVHVGRIRQAIEIDVKTPKRVLTVRGVGYMFAKQQD